MKKGAVKKQPKYNPDTSTSTTITVFKQKQNRLRSKNEISLLLKIKLFYLRLLFCTVCTIWGSSTTLQVLFFRIMLISTEE